MHLGMGRIRDLRGEEMAKLALSCIFVEFMGKRPSFVSIVIKHNCN